jgi:hypothetical protein
MHGKGTLRVLFYYLSSVDVVLSVLDSRLLLIVLPQLPCLPMMCQPKAAGPGKEI